MANGGTAVGPATKALKPAGKSHTSPTEQKQGKVCYIDVFRLTDLPDIMDKKGWKVSAALMRKWFHNPAHSMSDQEKVGDLDARQYPANLVDSSTVTMAWALSFPRVKKDYDSLFGSKGLFKSAPAKYESPAARRMLVRRLVNAGKFTRYPEQFGNLRDSVLNVNEQWQFQFHVVDDNSAYAEAWIKDTVKSDPNLDDMWGALARFAFKIAGEGTVIPKTKVVDTGIQCEVQVEYYEVSVQKIGIYIRDTYDFNGDQYLGHWSKTSDPYVRVYQIAYSAGSRSARGDCPDDFVYVDNERFRAHRTATGRGGDLLVFSDILITTLKQPFTFRVTPAEVAQLSGGAK